MGVSRVDYNDETLINLSEDTVTADTLAEGVTAHDANGDPIVGTMTQSGPIESGQCGENVFWELYENGLLVISGSGPANHVESTNKASPFRKRKDITDVIIKDGVTTIGHGLFEGCSLENIIVPESVKSVESSAFASCENLKAITLPSGCTTINSLAFSICSNLSRIVIPDSVTFIGEAAFFRTTGGEYVPLEVLYTGTKEQWDNIAISEDGNDGLFTATLHCEYEEVIVKEEQEVTYPTITQNGTYEILPEEGKVMSKATVEVDVKDADTVDGWHVAVRDDGTSPPTDTTNTLTFVYTKGG